MRKIVETLLKMAVRKGTVSRCSRQVEDERSLNTMCFARLAIHILSQAIQVFDTNLHTIHWIPDQISCQIGGPVNVGWLLEQRVVKCIFGVREVRFPAIGPFLRVTDHPSC